MWRQTVIRMINIDLFNYNKTAAENKSTALSKTENFHIKTTVVDVEDPRLLNSLL